MAQEKTTPIVLPEVHSPSSDSIDLEESQGFDNAATKKLVRKLDWHLIPFLSLIYLLCFLDRTNIGNARLDNLEVDLGLHGLQYNDCLAILFPFYIAAEIPSNMMMKRYRPSVWLTFIMVMWSIAMICQGFVKNYAGLMVTRAFLGVFEGGLFPGVNYFITQWYCRHECGFRMAMFFSAATLAGAFGGILARGIAEMDGVGGIAAWAWIFILEGLASIAVSFSAYWVINDYPSTATFISDKERNEVERRLAADHGPLSNTFDYKYVWQALKDWKIYIHMLICMAAFCPIYSFSLFLPTIIKNMGYTANQAQLMSVPPYVAACFLTILASWIADRAKQRGVFMLGFQIVAIAGFALLASTSTPSTQYAGTVLAAIGIFPQVPLALAWNSNNIGGSLKRGTGIAMQVMGGNCGGIIASYVYLTRDGPRYVLPLASTQLLPGDVTNWDFMTSFIRGHSILIGFVGMAFFLTTFMSLYLRRENRRRDSLARQERPVPSTVNSALEEMELADNASWFRYTL